MDKARRDRLASFVLLPVVLVAAGIVAYFTARRELRMKFDASLRDLRIVAYKVLWKDLQPLAKYGRTDPLSKRQADDLCTTLRTWYFETGGLVLSTQTRRDYFALQDGLEVVRTATETAQVTDEDDEFLRVLASRLRSGMTRDVGTRRTYVFRGDAEGKAERVKPGIFKARPGDTTGLRVAAPLLPWKTRPRITFADGTRPERSNWDASRRELEFRVTRGAETEKRVLLFEADDEAVEGPKGWERGETTKRRTGVVWKRR